MIEINNLTKIKIDDKFLKKVAKIVLKEENIKMEELSIVLVGKKTIRELNEKHRKKDEATDVLSFGNINDIGLKEIVICPQMIKKEDLAAILIHGILHILGYDHRGRKEAEKMEKKQEYYLSKI